MATKWSDWERAILHDIWITPGSIKEQMHRLEGRSWMAIKHQARNEGLPARGGAMRCCKYSWCEEAIQNALKAGRPLTSLQIAEMTPASRQSITALLRKGHGTKYYIAGWTRTRAHGDWYPKWLLGCEEDVGKPKNKTRSLASIEWRRRKQRLEKGFSPFDALIQQVAA